MENLEIHEVPDAPFYPSVNFNSKTGVCEIAGESYMEETYKFYSPLLEWLRSYTTDIQGKVEFNFRLTYFNTSSSRLILDMLEILRRYKDNGGDVSVNWYYDPDDPDMKDEVEDFKIETGLEINLKTY